MQTLMNTKRYLFFIIVLLLIYSYIAISYESNVWLAAFYIVITLAISFGITLFTVKIFIKPQLDNLKFGDELIAHTMDGIIIIDDHGTIESINPAGERLFGYVATEITGKNVNILMPNPYHTEHNNYLAKYIQTGKSKILGTLRELPAIRKNGDNFYLELSANEIFFGKQRKFAGFIREITERKRAQDLQIKLTKEIENLYNNAPCGYHSLDTNGVFQLINDTELSWLGYDRNEIIGKMSVKDILTSESVKLFQKNFPIFMKQGFIQDLELEIIRKDGSVFIALVNATANYDDTGKISTSRSTMIDITKYKQIEKARIEANESSRAKSEFLSHMSHEIRTPLNIINGMAQILLESSLNEEQKKYVKMYEKASNTLLSIINDILDISKIESNSMTIVKSPINIKNIVMEVVELFTPKALHKKLNLSSNIETDIPDYVLGDELRIRQVLMNLLGNAVKFTHAGEISIKVELNKNQSKNGNLLFQVSDTGIGISPEQEYFLFKPFSQTNSSITKNYGGTGLGLAICKKLVSMMGGEIWFSSNLGVGSTFSFTLACESTTYTKDQYLKNSTMNLQRINHSNQQPLAKAGNILLVDDSEENRNLIKFFLKNTKHNVSEAENGAVALAKFKTEPFDLILMDMQMPILDGYSATQQIRNWEKTNKLSHTPIVALTAYALVEEQQKSIAAGCDKHMAKPIKKTELISLINNLLSNT
jgi:PAS domain S-box-containing protein